MDGGRMRIGRMFVITFAFFFMLWGFSAFSISQSEEVQQIDAEIQELELMKKGYESRALRHENQAEYLQFDQRAVLETRRHLQIAEEERGKAAFVQEQIDQLKEKKRRIVIPFARNKFIN
ncbi:MAG: hypothetical protein ACD_37C00407G0001 [uncultured bacterium]|nr:MAG: hypothetical protein ACD_37C00407G0001 [uncultured bacterium]